MAATVYEHFATLPSREISIPDPATIEAIIDASFWASLRREESYIPKISLAFLSPGQAGQALLSSGAPAPSRRPRPARARGREARHPPRGVGARTAISRSGEPPGPCPGFCFTLEVVAPGLLVIKESRDENAGKYLNVAVLEGDQVKVLDQRAARTPDCPDLLASLLGLDPPRSAGDVNVLVQLAISMRAHGRGGSLLVVPAGS